MVKLYNKTTLNKDYCNAQYKGKLTWEYKALPQLYYEQISY